MPRRQLCDGLKTLAYEVVIDANEFCGLPDWSHAADFSPRCCIARLLARPDLPSLYSNVPITLIKARIWFE